jgi:uncharacterized protein YcaQ
VIVTPEQARRLFLVKQRLAGARPGRDAAALLQLVRELGCLQLDPISVVDRTHRLVLWSRVGAFDQAALDRLLWQDRSLFEYWAHCASIVPTEDYPIHHLVMRRYPHGKGPWALRVRAFLASNLALRRYVLRRIRADGPLSSRQLADGMPGSAPLHRSLDWTSAGWNSGRNLSRMLDFLWFQGKIMVAGRAGLNKVWDLTERVLPGWTPRDRLTPAQVTRLGAERAVRALGVATARHIQQHFIRGRYHQLPAALAALEKAGQLARVAVDGWPGAWYVHADDLALLDHAPVPERTVLLSPFDNLICDRARTRQFFGFDYTIEIYTPPARRKYGYYVLPILHGDRLIGRIDPVMDRATQTLTINAVHAEKQATRAQGRAVAAAIDELGGFLGARTIRYGRRRPAMWKL